MSGRLNVNVEPTSFSLSFSLLLVAHIFPPCISIILLQINNPKPVPAIGDLVTNFVKILGNTAGCIHAPVSFILIKISSYLSFVLSFFISTITVILPSFVNLMALSNKL